MKISGKFSRNFAEITIVKIRKYYLYEKFRKIIGRFSGKLQNYLKNLRENNEETLEKLRKKLARIFNNSTIILSRF